MATIEQVTKLAEERGITSRAYQGALGQIEAYARSDMPLYQEAEYLRAEILRVIRECREEIAAAKAAATR